MDVKRKIAIGKFNFSKRGPLSQQDISRATIQTEVARHAWQSEAFKKKLFLSPHAALAEIGIKVAQDVEISVVEEHSKKMVLVLPANPIGAMQAFIEAISPTPPPGPGHLPPGGPGGPGGPEVRTSSPDCQIVVTQSQCQITQPPQCQTHTITDCDLPMTKPTCG